MIEFAYETLMQDTVCVQVTFSLGAAHSERSDPRIVPKEVYALVSRSMLSLINFIISTENNNLRILTSCHIILNY